MKRSRQEEILRKLMENRRKAAGILVKTENRALANVVDLSFSLSEQLQKGLKAGAFPRNGEAALSTIDRLLTQADSQVQNRLLDASENIFDDQLDLQVDQISTFGTIAPRRIQVLAQQFDAQFRPDLVSEAYNGWISRIGESVFASDRLLRDTIADAISKGDDYRDAAKAFLEKSTISKTVPGSLRTDPQILNLPLIQQKIDPMIRAIRVMRTEFTRLNNLTSITFAEDFGYDLFINLGIGDDRQSEECAEASLEDPMSLDDWRAGLGLAPRHPYCRCLLQAVPRSIQKTLSSPGIVRAGSAAEDLVPA
jgi:hypothetical protein